LSWFFCVWYNITFDFFFLHMIIQFSQVYLLNRLFFHHCVFLVPLLNISWMHAHGFILNSILFHWLICLPLCQYYTFLITIVLKRISKWRCIMPPALFFFLRISLTILHLLWFYMNYNCFSVVIQNTIEILIKIVLIL
jgi:hypothetical protein